MDLNKLVALSRNPKTLIQAGTSLTNLPTGKPLRFMHVCGTHENTIARYGLRKLLPEHIEIIAGPGCPVCVCPANDIDLAIQAAQKPDTILTTFGDMMRVPGSRTLLEIKSEGYDVRVVTSIFEAVNLAKENPEKRIVFFAIGFETTACTTAAAIMADPPENFFILVSHRLVPPALSQLSGQKDLKLDGFVLPGHVLAVTGPEPYIKLAEELNLPMVVAGFEPVDVLMALKILAEKAATNESGFFNSYQRVVQSNGNVKAVKLMQQAFEIEDAHWRGLGTIPASGYKLKNKFSRLDAAKALGLLTSSLPETDPPGCRCGEIMIGNSLPEKCNHYGRICTPEHPVGPCMVGIEGTCRNHYEFMEIEND